MNSFSFSDSLIRKGRSFAAFCRSVLDSEKQIHRLIVPLLLNESGQFVSENDFLTRLDKFSRSRQALLKIESIDPSEIDFIPEKNQKFLVFLDLVRAKDKQIRSDYIFRTLEAALFPFYRIRFLNRQEQFLLMSHGSDNSPTIRSMVIKILILFFDNPKKSILKDYVCRRFSFSRIERKMIKDNTQEIIIEKKRKRFESRWKKHRQIADEYVENIWINLIHIFKSPSSPEIMENGQSIVSYLMRILTRIRKHGRVFSFNQQIFNKELHRNFFASLNEILTLRDFYSYVPQTIRECLNKDNRGLWDRLKSGNNARISKDKIMELNFYIICSLYGKFIEESLPVEFPDSFSIDLLQDSLELACPGNSRKASDKSVLRASEEALVLLFWCSGEAHKTLPYGFQKAIVKDYEEPGKIWQAFGETKQNLWQMRNRFINDYGNLQFQNWSYVMAPLDFRLGLPPFKLFSNFFMLRGKEADSISKWVHDDVQSRLNKLLGRLWFNHDDLFDSIRILKEIARKGTVFYSNGVPVADEKLFSNSLMEKLDDKNFLTLTTDESALGQMMATQVNNLIQRKFFDAVASRLSLNGAKFRAGAFNEKNDQRRNRMIFDDIILNLSRFFDCSDRLIRKALKNQSAFLVQSDFNSIISFIRILTRPEPLPAEVLSWFDYGNAQSGAPNNLIDSINDFEKSVNSSWYTGFEKELLFEFNRLRDEANLALSPSCNTQYSYRSYVLNLRAIIDRFSPKIANILQRAPCENCKFKGLYCSLFSNRILEKRKFDVAARISHGAVNSRE